MLRTLAVLLVLTSAALLGAKEDQVLKAFLEDNGVAGRWIYDDIEAGFAEAKKTGKPLLVCFSCVP